MTLRSIAMTAILGALPLTSQADGQEQIEKIDVSGFVRATLYGKKLNNPNFPEAQLKLSSGKWSALAMPDVFYRAASNDYGVRVHTAELAYKGDGITTKIGVLAPYTLTLSGEEFVSGMPSAVYSIPMQIKPGIAGAFISQDIFNANDFSASLKAIGGTRIEGLSKFGADDAPGIGAAILGGGFEVKSAHIKAGYNYVSYGASPTGKELEEHYGYAAGSLKAGRTALQVIAEGRESNGDFSHLAFLQASCPLNKKMTLRALAGELNGDPVVEALVLLKVGRVALQAGSGYNFTTNKAMPMAGFRLSY